MLTALPVASPYRTTGSARPASAKPKVQAPAAHTARPRPGHGPGMPRRCAALAAMAWPSVRWPADRWHHTTRACTVPGGVGPVKRGLSTDPHDDKAAAKRKRFDLQASLSRKPLGYKPYTGVWRAPFRLDGWMAWHGDSTRGCPTAIHGDRPPHACHVARREAPGCESDVRGAPQDNGRQALVRVMLT
jgi:hypothetical protein